MSKFLLWLASTKIGRMVVMVAALIAAGVGTWITATVKARREQAAIDAGKQAKAEVGAANAARDTYIGASKAAAQVRAEASKQPPPDPVKRDDLENTF